MSGAQQGREFHTHTHKKDGDEGVLKDEFKRDGEWARQDHDRADDCNVAAGITISRGNYQFARIDIGLTFVFDPAVIEEDAAFDVAQAIVDEMLAREEAEIRGSTRTTSALPKFGLEQGIRGRSVYVGYGLTLNGAAKFESHRIDIGRTRRIADDADLAAEFEKLGEQISERITVEREKVEGRSGDKGI